MLSLLRALSVGSLLVAVACGGAQSPNTAQPAPRAAASSVQSGAPAPRAEVDFPTAELALVRLGSPSFGSHPSFLASSPDDRFVATSMGLSGAEVEIFDGVGAPDGPRRAGTAFVELERAVRALDFSQDGATLLISWVGREAAGLRLVAVPGGKVLREIPLAGGYALDHFLRGPEGRWLADGSFVACDGGALLQWRSADADPRRIAEVPDGAFVSTSPDRRWFVISTPAAVLLRKAEKPGVDVARRARPSTTPGARLPDPRAFVDDTGTVLFDERGRTILRERSGTERDLGDGGPRGLGPEVALLRTDGRVDVLDRQDSRRVRLAASTAWLAPSQSRVFAHSGADEADAVSAVSLSELRSGATAPLRSKPRFVSFGLDPGTLLVGDADVVVVWDVATKRVARRIALPDPTRHVRGVFRTATDVIVMAGAVYRLAAKELEEIGATYASRPRAFVRRDGVTVVCAADATERCQGHFVWEKRATRLGAFAFSYLFPLAGGLGFHEGPYTESGSDLGVSRITQAEGERALEATWVRDVDLWWAAPSEDGGVVVTMEGADRLHRRPFLRRVNSHGAGAPCPLGKVRPSRDAPLALAPDGETAAVPVVDEGALAKSGNGVLLLDVDACTGRRVSLPARPLSTDFAPDGRTLAVGLADRTVVLVPVAKP